MDRLNIINLTYLSSSVTISFPRLIKRKTKNRSLKKNFVGIYK